MNTAANGEKQPIKKLKKRPFSPYLSCCALCILAVHYFLFNCCLTSICNCLFLPCIVLQYVIFHTAIFSSWVSFHFVTFLLLLRKLYSVQLLPLTAKPIRGLWKNQVIDCAVSKTVHLLAVMLLTPNGWCLSINALANLQCDMFWK